MRHSPFTAIYDACVLYPAPLRDFLMWLGLSGRFRARWSQTIHEEWKRNLLINRTDLTQAQVDRTSYLMDRAIPDGLVEGYESLAAGLTLPDPDDRHVLAAAEVLNDINGELVNLYRVVKHHLEEFVRQFKWALSSRQVFEWLKDTPAQTLTDIQRAARFFYLQHSAFGGRVSGQTYGTATTVPPGINLLRIEETLSAAHLRLANAYIENLGWRDCMTRYDRAHTFFFVDPPYWKTEGYGVPFEFAEYERLADTLRGLKGKAIVTLNDHPDIREVFADFDIESTDIRYTVGGGGGVAAGITVNASRGKGKGEGEDRTWTHTHVTAGERLTLESGGDTTLRGAIVSGEQVVADVGGNLNIESLQDTSTFKSRDRNMGGSVTVGYGFAAGSVNFGQQKIDSDYASVTEQSRIEAGDGGFQIRVAGNTGLKGAAITSTEQAVQDGVNTLSTATLTASDITNRAEYEASSVSVGLGYTKKDDKSAAGSGVGTNQQGQAATGGDQVPGTTLPSLGNFSASPPMVMAASGDSSSVTRSGISAAQITLTDEAAQQALTGQSAQERIASLNRDVHTGQDGANALKPIFNEQEIKAGFEIVAALQRETGTFLNNRAKEAAAAQQALDQERAKPEAERDPAHLTALEQRVNASAIWAPGGTGRQVLTALAAAAGGNVTGASSQFAQSLVVNYLQQQGAAYIGDLVRKGTLTEGSPAHATLHAIVACAGAMAGSQDCASGALGAAASSVLTHLFLNTPNESSEQKEAKRNLIATLVTGIAAAADSALPTASNAAIAAIDNNYLTQQDVEYLAGKLAECKASDEACRDAVVAEAKRRSDENDQKLKACTTQACFNGYISEIVEGVRNFDLLYAADQAVDNTEKLAFGKISDMETYSLLLAANMAAGLPVYQGGSMSWEDFIARVDNFEFTQGSESKTWWQRGVGWWDSWGKTSKQPHEYTHISVACSIMSGLSCGKPSEQFDALRRYAGPGTDGKSLAGNGEVSHLNIGLSFGSVTHLIDPATGSLINITLPGAHPLHPGFVIRQVVPDGKGGFSVETKGWGTGSSPIFNSNVWLARPVWGPNTWDIGNDAKTITDHEKYREHIRREYYSMPRYFP